MNAEFGTLTDTLQFDLFSAPFPTRVNSLTFLNTSGSNCWVKTFHRGVQIDYVDLGPLERAKRFTDRESMDAPDSLRIQAQSPNSITYFLNVERV